MLSLRLVLGAAATFGLFAVLMFMTHAIAMLMGGLPRTAGSLLFFALGWLSLRMIHRAMHPKRAPASAALASAENG